MSRLILLLILALWLVSPESMAPAWFRPAVGAAIFVGGFLLIVAAVAVWARLVARHVDGQRLHGSLRWFNFMATAARLLIPAWMAAGLFTGIGWGRIVWSFLDPATTLHLAGSAPVQLALPGLIAGVMPAMAAWVGLWWAQFPADVALREQSILCQLDQGLPVHAPPRLRDYLLANLRMQVLLMLLPILLILLLRDLAAIILHSASVRISSIDWFENVIVLPAGLLVFLFAPEVLRRVMSTRPLPDSPLRRRLEAICRSAGLRYREILLWHTHNSIGNAAVMGMLPRLRYVLLSDLLLETLTDEQIEAVFAHEVGHIVHRHMIWYVVFFAAMALAAMGPGTMIEQTLRQWLSPWAAALGGTAANLVELLLILSSLAFMLGAFGFVSRRFERQADVFAARMMQSDWCAEPLASGNVQLATSSHVGVEGATIFASALQRVAAINNIPVAARSWCHGSIARRMGYVQALGEAPERTAQFDRVMFRLYAGLVLAVIVSAAILLLVQWQA